MTSIEMLQEIAQEMAEMQKAMEQSGDATPIWVSAEVARQDLLDSWSEDAGAWDIEDIDTETRDQLWDMVVEAYYGPRPAPEAEQKAIEALVEAWDLDVLHGEIDEAEMAESLTLQVEGGEQGWDMSAEDAETHPDIALMIGLQIDPYTEVEDPTDEDMAEADRLWEAWGRVVGEAARRWLANHPEAAQAAREEE